jgi:hypothetical protein
MNGRIYALGLMLIVVELVYDPVLGLWLEVEYEL